MFKGNELKSTDLLSNELSDDWVPNIPLPNEIPQMPNLQDLPPQVLHSGTVETLIGQNEDLFARLKVSFRTNAELERRLMVVEQNELELKHINSSLLAQIQVLQEKDKAHKLKSDELEQRLETANIALAQEKERSSSLQLQVDERSQAFENLKAKLNQAASHLETQESALKNIEVELNANFEGRIIELISNNEKLSAELKLVQEKAARLQNVFEKQAEAENKSVYFERRATELEARYNKDLAAIQSELTIFRTEAKSLSVQLHNTESKLNDKLAENVRLKESLTDAQDQFESLQTLWNEAQKRLEESRLKYDSLHKINHELSRKLKEQRIQGADSAEIAELSEAKEQKFERLESLLAGIQAGFPKSIDIIENESSEAIDRSQETKSL